MTVRDEATLLANMADGGNNTAEEVRDIIASAARWGFGWDPLDGADGADDTYWDGSDYATDFSTVTVSGSQTITERRGALSVKFNSQTASDMNCGLKARAFSIGDEFVIPIRLFARLESFSFGGLVFTDDADAAAEAIGVFVYHDDGTDDLLIEARGGTLTLLTAVTSTTFTDWPTSSLFPYLYLKLRYNAANSFTWGISPDGISFTNWADGAVAKVMTPTHVGPAWSKWGGSEEAIASFGPLVKTA